MRMARCIARRFHDRYQTDLLEFGGGPVHVVAAASVSLAIHRFDDERSLGLVSSFNEVEVQAARKAYGSLADP